MLGLMTTVHCVVIINDNDTNSGKCAIVKHRSQEAECKTKIGTTTHYQGYDVKCYDHYLTFSFTEPNGNVVMQEIKMRQSTTYDDWTDTNFELGSRHDKYCNLYYNHDTMTALFM